MSAFVQAVTLIVSTRLSFSCLLFVIRGLPLSSSVARQMRFGQRHTAFDKKKRRAYLYTKLHHYFSRAKGMPGSFLSAVPSSLLTSVMMMEVEACLLSFFTGSFVPNKGSTGLVSCPCLSALSLKDLQLTAHVQQLVGIFSCHVGSACLIFLFGPRRQGQDQLCISFWLRNAP